MSSERLPHNPRAPLLLFERTDDSTAQNSAIYGCARFSTSLEPRAMSHTYWTAIPVGLELLAPCGPSNECGLELRTQSVAPADNQSVRTQDNMTYMSPLEVESSCTGDWKLRFSFRPASPLSSLKESLPASNCSCSNSCTQIHRHTFIPIDFSFKRHYDCRPC